MSIEKSPAFQFYPKDWLSDGRVRAMGHEARGIYIDLLSIYWNDGGLPSDVRALAARVAVPLRTFQRLWPLIAPCFEVGPNSINSKRLDAEKVKQTEYRSRQQEKGLKSAKSRIFNKPVQPRLESGCDPVDVRLEPEGNSPFASSSASSTANILGGRAVGDSDGPISVVEPPPAEDTRPTTTANGQSPTTASERRAERLLDLAAALGMLWREDVPQHRALARVVSELTAQQCGISLPDDGPPEVSDAHQQAATEIMRAISTTRSGTAMDSLDIRGVSASWAHVTADHAASRWARDCGLSI